MERGLSNTRILGGGDGRKRLGKTAKSIPPKAGTFGREVEEVPEKQTRQTLPNLTVENLQGSRKPFTEIWRKKESDGWRNRLSPPQGDADWGVSSKFHQGKYRSSRKIPVKNFAAGPSVLQLKCVRKVRVGRRKNHWAERPKKASKT